jgi:integrase
LGFDGRIVFHSFRHNASTILRNASADIRSEWIDAVLGHESSSKSQGATTYFKRVDPKNLKLTIEHLTYADNILIDNLFKAE